MTRHLTQFVLILSLSLFPFASLAQDPDALPAPTPSAMPALTAQVSDSDSDPKDNTENLSESERTEDATDTQQGNTFLEKLSFPLTEDKLIAYIRAGENIAAVNARWDALIAAARTDTLAMEYLQQQQKELGDSLQNFTGIREAEYREIYKLSLEDREFNRVIMAVKKGMSAQAQAELGALSQDITGETKAADVPQQPQIEN